MQFVINSRLINKAFNRKHNGHTGDDPKPNILDVSDRYKVRTPCPSQGGRVRRWVGAAGEDRCAGWGDEWWGGAIDEWRERREGQRGNKGGGVGGRIIEDRRGEKEFHFNSPGIVHGAMQFEKKNTQNQFPTTTTIPQCQPCTNHMYQHLHTCSGLWTRTRI